MKVSRTNLLRCAALASFLALVACGSPDGPSGETFEYTAVPYVTKEAEGGTTRLVVLDARGRPDYLADEVLVTVDRDARDDFFDWLDSSPFESRFTYLDEPPGEIDFFVVVVRVPPGSVPDALLFIEGRPGVRGVRKASISTLRGARD